MTDRQTDRPPCRCLCVVQVLMLVTPFLPLHILVPLPVRRPKTSDLLWEEAAISHTRLFIDCAPKAGRVFWQRIFVERVAARLTGLTEITLCHPENHPAWCSDVLVSVIETTAAPPARPDGQADAPGSQSHREVRQSASRLQTIAFEKVRLGRADLHDLEREPDLLPPPRARSSAYTSTGRKRPRVRPRPRAAPTMRHPYQTEAAPPPSFQWRLASVTARQTRRAGVTLTRTGILQNRSR